LRKTTSLLIQTKLAKIAAGYWSVVFRVFVSMQGAGFDMIKRGG
jgi:hypothetical protein